MYDAPNNPKWRRNRRGEGKRARNLTPPKGVWSPEILKRKKYSMQKLLFLASSTTKNYVGPCITKKLCSKSPSSLQKFSQGSFFGGGGFWGWVFWDISCKTREVRIFWIYTNLTSFAGNVPIPPLNPPPNKDPRQNFCLRHCRTYIQR